jgi:DNA polymerase III subunit alpha
MSKLTLEQLNLISPTRFTGLHAHSSFSTFDGLGYPKEHIDFVLSEAQGMDSWALTDHGNGSGLAHARAHTEKMQKAGRNYRQLYGVEFYFVPSLDGWRESYDAHRQSVKDAKTSKQKEKLATEKTVIIADQEVEQGGHIIEDEEETKRSRADKPEWKRYYHLVIVAKNQVGLGNLFTLVKKSYKHGFYRFPRIDYKMLKEHGEGLVVSTACVGGLASGLIYKQFAGLRFDELHPGLMDNLDHYNPIMSRLENMTDRFVDCVGRDNFFLEMQFNDLPAQHLTNRCLLDLSQKTSIPLIATADSHFPDPKKWQARELYKKLGWMGAKLDQTMLPKEEDLKCKLYPKNARQMWGEFTDGYQKYDFYNGREELVRDAIERTHDIAWQKCEDTWIDKSVKLPKFGTPEKPAFKMLTDLVKDAMIREGLASNPEYINRMKEEMSDIKFLGYEAYFLAMYQIFHLAEKKTLFGPGRGSGAGSLVNFLLGITQIDPLPHGLLWSRFLGRHRTSWPDIDTDAGDRDALIDASRELFGDDAVIPVSNFNTLKLKSLIKDISKFYGVPFDEVNKMTGPLQDEVMPHAKDENQEKSVFVLKHEDCLKYSPGYKSFMEKYPEVGKHAETLFMENRSIGRHAGGVIIAPPDDLAKTMPIIGVRGELQTPWTEGMNFRNLEDNGFLKFDFLGLTLLKDVENCVRRILVKEGNVAPTFDNIKQFFDEKLNCRYNDQNDKSVWEHVYHEGRFTGVFQFTAPGARKFCLAAKPTTITELAALTAIYRPGPLKANVHRKYVKAKRNASEIKYDHPVIEKILGPTFNFVVFQEQFMSLAVELAGFSPGESDKLRKTLVKKSLDTMGNKGGEREIAKKKFVEGAFSLHGIDRQITTALWETIEAFSVYGFNKSHAVSYAVDSYYAAWLHTHHEKEWLATILQSENNSPAGLAKAMAEIKSYGFQFAPADINLSGEEWTFSDEADAFVPPLSSVKGLGGSAMSEILNMRPYVSLDDLFYNDEGSWKHSKLNKTALSSLCKIEAFSSIKEVRAGKVKNHRQLLAMITEDKNYDILKKGRFGLTKTQVKRAQKNNEIIVPIIDVFTEKYEGVPDWTRHDKISNYVEITSGVDADLVFPPTLMTKIVAKNVGSIHDVSPGDRGVGWLCASEVIQKKTKNGKTFHRIKAINSDYKSVWLRVWGNPKEAIMPYSIWVADVHHDESWGYSTSCWKMKKVDAYD